MGENKPNISKHTNGIIRQLGMEPVMVKSLLVTPGGVRAEVYLPDENGKKHITDDGTVATETRTWEVRT